jgi:Ribbon-helix-helix domain
MGNGVAHLYAKNRAPFALQIQVCVSLPPEQVERVKQLSSATRVPMAAYFREALEDLLRKYASVLRKGKA